MAVKIWHNPRCSKSRQTLEILESKGLDPQVVFYLETTPSADEIRDVLQKLGKSARQIMRTKEQAYKDNNLDNPDLSEDQLIAAMVKDPILIERPVVIHEGKAALGRPPENVLDIL